MEKWTPTWNVHFNGNAYQLLNVWCGSENRFYLRSDEEFIAHCKERNLCEGDFEVSKELPTSPDIARNVWDAVNANFEGRVYLWMHERKELAANVKGKPSDLVSLGQKMDATGQYEYEETDSDMGLGMKTAEGLKGLQGFYIDGPRAKEFMQVIARHIAATATPKP